MTALPVVDYDRTLCCSACNHGSDEPQGMYVLPTLRADTDPTVNENFLHTKTL